MPRPLIGIAPKFLPGDEGQPLDIVAARRSVTDCVYRAGGQPVLLYVEDPADAAMALDAVAAMVFPGGGDSDPILYGDANRHPALRLVDPLQDASDLAFIRAAIERRLPTLAICRGMQTLNIAQGGSLVQHLEPTTVEHWDSTHQIAVTEPASCVARVMGAQTFTGRSFHQQAVKDLGRDLVITARAADGCVEAIEHVAAPVVGLQWHPEVPCADGPPQLEPFRWLVAQARDRG